MCKVHKGFIYNAENTDPLEVFGSVVATRKVVLFHGTVCTTWYTRLYGGTPYKSWVYAGLVRPVMFCASNTNKFEAMCALTEALGTSSWRGPHFGDFFVAIPTVWGQQ